MSRRQFAKNFSAFLCRVLREGAFLPFSVAFLHKMARAGNRTLFYREGGFPVEHDRLQGHSAARAQARLAGAEEGREVALAHRLNHLHRHQFVVLAAQIAVVAYPGLCRPIFFCSRSYNYACSDGALLLEFGTNGNTMEEAQYTAELIAPVIAEVISGRAE